MFKPKYLLILITMLLTSCTGIDTRSLYIIHIHGDWCKTCKKIDNVIHETADEFFKKREHISYIVFDETNPEALLASRKRAKDCGLEKLFEYERHTGEVLYVDKASKLVLARFYGVADKDQYINAGEDLLKGRSVASVVAEPKTYQHPKLNMELIKGAKLYVIDVHHDLCGSCVITAPVFEAVAKDFLKNPEIVFITFDLTSPATIDKSRNLARVMGLMDIFDSQKHTGEVLFIDPASKEIKARLVSEVNRWNYHNIIRKLTQ